MHKLREQTQQYWLVSSTWNNRVEGDLNVQDALLHLKGIIQSNRPSRALSKASGLLMADIIAPKRVSKRKRLPKPTPLQKPAQTAQ